MPLCYLAIDPPRRATPPLSVLLVFIISLTVSLVIEAPYTVRPPLFTHVPSFFSLLVTMTSLWPKRRSSDLNAFIDGYSSVCYSVHRIQGRMQKVRDKHKRQEGEKERGDNAFEA